MFSFVKEFFVNKQTFASVLGDAAGAVALLAATPDGLAMISSLAGPWATAGVVAVAYLGGAVSGRKTKPIKPGKILKRLRKAQD